MISWVWKEKERVGFDPLHVASKGVLWASPITPNLLVCEGREMHRRRSSKNHVQCSEITGERNTQTERQ